MRLSATSVFVALFAALTSAQICDLNQDPQSPGYSNSIPSTVPANKNLNFGSKNTAILQLDLQNALIQPIADTKRGAAFIRKVKRWNDAVHNLNPQPLTIFSRITAERLGNPPEEQTEIYPSFFVSDTDTVIEKGGFYAGFGNNLEGILENHKIKNVVLSGIRTSGVILATAGRLNDLSYNVYVIANNSIESPPNNPCIHESLLAGAIPKLGVNIITIEQALGAIGTYA